MRGLIPFIPTIRFPSRQGRPAKRGPHRGWTLLAILAGITSPLSADQSGDFTYTENATSITITGYPDNAVGAVGIPATIAGKPVTEIGTGAFSECGGVTSVTIPDGVTTIGDSAFRSCGALAGIVLPADLTTIGASAFRSCVKLDGLTLPAHLTTIGGRAFGACAALTTVTIPSGVTAIGESAFSGCSSLTAITVDPANVGYSSPGGLLYDRNQTNLIQFPGGKPGEVTLPASVTGIHPNAFFICPNLTAIHVHPSNTTYSSVDDILYENSKMFLLRCPGGRAGIVTLPVYVTRIREFAFEYCDALTGVILPEGLTNIEGLAFDGCRGLTSITIPASVKNIGPGAFQSCVNLLGACFLGNSPTVSMGAFSATAPGFTAYHFDGKTGFSSPPWFQSPPFVNMGPVSPLPPWLLANGLPYNTSPHSDPNSDGVNLLLAYALNLDPNQNLSGSLPAPAISGNQMRLTFYGKRPGVTYEVQRSGNLTDWTTTGVTLSTPDKNGFRTATVETTGSGCLLRIVASY